MKIEIKIKGWDMGKQKRGEVIRRDNLKIFEKIIWEHTTVETSWS